MSLYGLNFCWQFSLASKSDVPRGSPMGRANPTSKSASSSLAEPSVHFIISICFILVWRDLCFVAAGEHIGTMLCGCLTSLLNLPFQGQTGGLQSTWKASAAWT